ncbi:MAG TPA: glycosyltransferase family 1 protein [Candidatus Woesebacteria bacterium]|nr:glycosyltransferase family 1 protein [Candidatus Woesebacteria bacterium]
MSVNKTFRIGFDARLAGKKHAGIGRYSENLILKLIELAAKNNQVKVKFVIFFFDTEQAKEVLSQFFNHPNVEVVITNIKHYGLQEQLVLPKFYKKAQLDLLYVPHWNVPIFYRGKLIVTIHDLLWHEQKGTQATTLKAWQYFVKYLVYKYVSKQAAKKAEVIFVPTETIKKTVIHYYPFAKNKIIVSKEGIASKYQNALNHQPTLQPRIKKQLIYTGSLYPHKNIAVVIKSLKKLPKYQLLIASSRSIFQDQIQTLVAHYKVKKQVIFLGFVPDEKLITLYQQSMALVQPSLSEGFGLTGIEAMASQIPVLASDIEVFREIYQDAAFFFDPNSSASFIKALENLESANRKEVIKRGVQVASQYSFDKMAKDIWSQFLKQL